MKISLFKNHKATEGAETITITEFLDRIKSGRWQKEIEKLRSLATKDEKDEMKKTLPGATISGIFPKRNAASLLQHSGFMSVDFDAEFDRNLILSDPYTYSLFTSASARGIAVLVKIDPAKHDESFNFLQKYYFETYGYVIDPAPRSTVSLRCVSYDPDITTNPDSRISKTYKPKPPKNQSLPLALNDDELGKVVRDVLATGADIAPDYDSYMRLALSLASAGEHTREYFHALCAVNQKYKHSQAEKKFNDARRSKTKITIGTFYHMARQAGVTLPQADHKPIAIAAMGKKSGRTKEAVAEQLVTINGLSQTNADHIANQVFTRDDITLKTLAADPEHLIESLIYFIANNYPLRRNAITQKIELRGQPLTDEDINDFYLQSRAAFNSPMINKDLVQSIIFSSNTPTYHPILEFIAKHRAADTGIGHIDRLISAINTTTPHASGFIRKWIIAIQAAIDGNPVRLMLTFVGPQYNGKTEFFRRLLPPALKSFYAESKLDRGKDDELLMCQKLIVMDDEMGGKSKQDEKRLKELTSKEYFSLRAPYRRDNVDYKRLAILCGTSNPVEIMNDPTGNTRILPVHVDSIDYEILNSVDRTALFMEAYHAYSSGESWQLEATEINTLGLLSDNFSSIAFERELILQHFQPANGGQIQFMTATEIKNEIEVGGKQQIKNMTRFGIELRKLFGDPKSHRKGAFPVKCYPVNQIQTANGLTTDFSEPTDNEEIPF